MTSLDKRRVSRHGSSRDSNSLNGGVKQNNGRALRSGAINIDGNTGAGWLRSYNNILLSVGSTFKNRSAAGDRNDTAIIIF